MDKPQRKTVPIIAAAVLFLLIAATISYVIGYFALSSSQVTERGRLLRVYSSEWLAEAYTPMAFAEKVICGRRVLLGWRR